MKKLVVFFYSVIFSIALPLGCFAADAWPGSAGTVLTTLSEPSGVIWHPERQTLFVVEDGGTLDEISPEGELLDFWTVGGDIEGITLAEGTRYLYLGIEQPADSIVEFDLQTGLLTGKSWNLTSWMTGPDASGLEGLAYSGEYFYAGLQADGRIYVFDVNLSVSGEVEFVETITPNAAYASDISGIDFNSYTGITYSVFDTGNAMVELNASKEMVHDFSLPGDNQEGVAIKPNCAAHSAEVYIAEDNAEDDGQLMKYTDYPITCIDADSDEVFVDVDCNDNNAAISSNQTYYRDVDGDGMGSNTTTSVCSLTAPQGYVTNNHDLNDTDFDNDGVSTGTDCNDNNVNISSNHTFYRDLDGDGMGSDAATSVCSLTAPQGYVTNSDDLNDEDFDNDGSASGTDCNENDNSLSQKNTFYRDADLDGLGDAGTSIEVCSLTAPDGYVADNTDAVDVFANGRYMYINGSDHAFFDSAPNSVTYTSLNFYDDEYQEVIAVGLFKKRTYIVTARVSGNNVTITKRGVIKKKYKTVQIVPNPRKKKFVTKFNSKKKYTWKMKKTGSFTRSH